MATSPDDELREALRRHGESAGRRWRAEVYRISSSDGKLRTVRMDLTSDDARALAALIHAGTGPPDNVMGTYLGTAAVARHIHVSQSTIRAWLARKLPKENPFPDPEPLLGRNRWQQSVIDAWRARQRQLQFEKQRRRGAPRASNR
jgi:predicted DNA-binding transcriptional regulator AlpA